MKDGPAVLVVGEWDSTGRSGIGLALRVIHGLGVDTRSACCAIDWVAGRAQRTCHLPLKAVAGQIDAAFQTATIAVCLIGALPTPEAVKMVMDRLIRRKAPLTILQPVFFRANGEEALRPAGIERLQTYLGHVDCVITDAPEAVELAGHKDQKDSPGEVARLLMERGAGAALIRSRDTLEEHFLVGGQAGHQHPDQGAALPCSVMAAAAAGRVALGDSIPGALRFARSPEGALAIQRALAVQASQSFPTVPGTG